MALWVKVFNKINIFLQSFIRQMDHGFWPVQKLRLESVPTDNNNYGIVIIIIIVPIVALCDNRINLHRRFRNVNLCQVCVYDSDKRILLHVFQLTRNLSLDGILMELNSKYVNETGYAIQEFDLSDSDDDDLSKHQKRLQQVCSRSMMLIFPSSPINI